MARTIAILIALVITSAAEQPNDKAAHAAALFQEADTFMLQVKDNGEKDYLISELAQSQLRSGFVANAISTAMRSDDPGSVLVSLGRIQASRGQYDSAMAAVAGQPHQVQDEVRIDIGIEQARRGDVDSALNTASSMLEGYDKESVLYFTALEMLRQKQTVRAKQLASSFTAPDHELPEQSEVGSDYGWRKPAPPPPPVSQSGPFKSCHQNALMQLQAGNVAKAVSTIEADDNPANVSSNFARLAREAAELGNLDAALQFAARVMVTGAQYEEGYYAETLLPIGRLWGARDEDAAANWARKRRTPAQKVLALSGVAEGVALGQ